MDLFASESHFVASADVVSAGVGAETILLEAKSGTYFSLDSVGTRVWRLVESATTFSQIHSAITRQFDVDPGVASADLQRFLVALRDHGLVKMEPGADAET